ncbi:MAG: glutaminyl-peptide cyclotransferase [Planctomycetota bacterium]
MNRLSKLYVAGAIAVLLAGAVFLSRLYSGSPDAAALWSYKIVNTFAHDPNAFTQGLVFEDGVLYEGTGLPGRSELRKVELETGAVLQKLKLADRFFGEGITILGDRIIQLTFQSRVGFVYNKETFELLQKFNYPTEGWGITHDGKNLIMSDGTPMLYFLDPENLTQISKKMVLDQDVAVWGLNELEYVEGEIYANVWPGDRIARIDPQTGQVTGWIDMKGLLDPDEQDGPIDVFNGIAYDPANRRLFVTGKFWPKLFEIKLVPAK